MELVLAVVLATLAISFFCSLLEACLLSLSSADLALLETRSARVGRIWRGLRENLQRPLAVILILNTFAHTLGAAVAGGTVERLYGESALLAFSLALSFVMIQWTEILPKTLGDRHNLLVARAAALPLRAAVWFMAPVIALVRLLNRPFERGRDRSPGVRDEIQALARHAAESLQIERAQGRLIAGAARLSERRVRDLMIPREEMSCIPADLPLEDALARALADAHTRYPLCEDGDVDRLAGYVNFKEMVAASRGNAASLRDLRRPLLDVPPDAPAASALRRFVEHHLHIAAVRDASGRTLGLLTLEDIVEEPLGEISGEYDRLPTMLVERSDGRLLAGGGCRLKDVAERLGVPLADGRQPLAEWIAARLGRPPEPGASGAAEGLRFTVRRMRRRRVFEAVVEKC